MHRVAITGLGCISAVGHTAPEHWEALKNGRSGIQEVTLVPPEQLNARVAAEVKNYDPADHFETKRLSLLDRFTQFSLVAAREAIADAGLDFSAGLGAETAVLLATGIGGITTLDNSFARLYGEGHPRVHPLTVPKLMVSAAASHITMEFGITGPSFAVSSACSSANHAIGEGMWMIRTGRARAAVVGGAETCVTLGTLKGWESLRVMATDTCRPFSRGRRGMVIGEGAGLFVLERMDDARARGATIYAELAGYGLTADAGDIVFPSEEGAAGALAMALQDGGLAPEDVDYINAHGTGTTANDVTETRAIRRVFGERADRLMVSSTKSMHGHGLGAAGALELVPTIMAIRDGVVPPTANFVEADPECDLDVVPNQARDVPVRAALSDSFAFGGLNAVIAVRSAD